MKSTITLSEGATVTCPFCMQVRVLTKSAVIENTEEERAALGAMECNCGEALVFQNRKKNKDNVPSLLDSFINFCQLEKHGDAATAPRASTDYIKSACFAVIDGKADKITLSVKEVKVKLASNKDKQLEMKLESKKGLTTTT